MGDKFEEVGEILDPTNAYWPSAMYVPLSIVSGKWAITCSGRRIPQPAVPTMLILDALGLGITFDRLVGGTGPGRPRRPTPCNDAAP